MNLRRDLPPLPERMKKLPLDHRGYPVPWFVAFFDGKPDFRVVRAGGISEAYNHQKCWLCGERRGAVGAFVIGPMCAVNRVSSEPPSHFDCAVFGATACPFLTRPNAARREVGLDELGTKEPAGVMLKRNPGVAVVWTSRNWNPFKVEGGGVLFNVGDPIQANWYAQGRAATRAEVMESINSGLPALREPAEAQGPRAVAALEKMLATAMTLVPGE